MHLSRHSPLLLRHKEVLDGGALVVVADIVERQICALNPSAELSVSAVEHGVCRVSHHEGPVLIPPTLLGGVSPSTTQPILQVHNLTSVPTTSSTMIAAAESSKSNYARDFKITCELNSSDPCFAENAVDSSPLCLITHLGVPGSEAHAGNGTGFAPMSQTTVLKLERADGGLYKKLFCPAAGTYRVDVLVDHQHVQGSPQFIECRIPPLPFRFEPISCNSSLDSCSMRTCLASRSQKPAKAACPGRWPGNVSPRKNQLDSSSFGSGEA